MSTKFQVTFPEALLARLRLTSKRKQVPVAGLVRQLVEDGLRREKQLSPRAAHPLAAIVGIVDSPETDLASRVDEIYD